MKKLFLLSLYSILLIALKAQTPTTNNVISGSVIDSLSKTPLEYATISIYLKGNKKPVNGTITDKTGHYILKEIPDGIFTITYEFIGYGSFTISNLAFSKNAHQVKNISLLAKKNDLQGVVIVAQQKLIENKIDKMIYNAEKDITSQSGSATDILKKVPQVSVDIDGNVQLAGSGGIRFLINGKPSTAFGSNIADVLQSIPASQIKSIEVITNPGAKYDAQGLGGIINIILKSSKAKGYNGNLSLTAGSLSENGSFNFNARHNNFGVNAFISGNQRLRSSTPTSSTRITNDNNTVSSLQQDGVGRFDRHGLQTGVGFDWTVKKLNSFSGNIAYNDFGYNGNSFTNQSILLNKAATQPPVVSLIDANSHYIYQNTDVSLNYKRTFAKEDQQLDIGFNTSVQNQHGNSGSQQLRQPQDSLYYGTQSLNPGNTKETQLNIDYTQPLQKNIILGFGGKSTFNNINSIADVLSYDPALKIFSPNPSLANNLTYKQKVYAGYTELSFPVGKLFNAKVGGRYERTEISSYYSNAQQQAKVPGYNTLVPSIFLSKKVGENTTIKLSYSKRIQRPGYDDLNPFVNTNDPKNISGGNPNLQPEIAHRYELGYSRDFGKIGSINANLFYRINENDIQPYIVYYPTYKVGDSTYTNVNVSTQQNIGKEQNAGINLFSDLHFSTKLNIRSNAFFFRRHTINVINAGYNYNSFNYRFNLNATYQFTPNLVAEFFGNFNSARHEAQGSYPSFTTYSFAIRRQFWKKKGSLALNANNFFSEYVNQKTNLFGPGFTVNSMRQVPFRSVSLNFTWKFGKLEFKKERSEDEQKSAPGE